MAWNISLFIFCMIYNFSEFDGFTVFGVLGLFPLLCSHGNLTLKLHSKNSKLNKEVLAKFIYGPT